MAYFLEVLFVTHDLQCFLKCNCYQFLISASYWYHELKTVDDSICSVGDGCNVIMKYDDVT